MKYASKTDIGKRLRNEDACRVPDTLESMPLVIVADGMGGHAGGALASSLAIEGLQDELLTISYASNPVGALKNAIQRVNVQIYRRAQSDPSLSGMGTTLVCTLLSGRRYIAACVGDSRIYHFDGETLAQVTRDHSLVEMLVEAGRITRDEARTHPQRNVITRALGISLRVDIDIFDREWHPGDILLLCSDGLHGCLDDEALKDILSADTALEEKCDAMVSLALSNDGSDNITVALVRCGEEDCA